MHTGLLLHSQIFRSCGGFGQAVALQDARNLSFRLRALNLKHHSHTMQISGLVPAQPAGSEVLKTFQGVTL